MLAGVVLLASGCNPTPTKDVASAPTWGPISAGDCQVEMGNLRRYSAKLHHQDSESCDGPFNNVMGAHFAKPDRCERLDDAWLGYWHVRDSTCAASMPTLPGPGERQVPNEPAEGYADLHNHLLAHVAFGETVLWGDSYGEPETVLQPIPESLRRSHQRVEALSSSGSIFDIYDGHDEQGHPSYSGWPTPFLKTHQQSHVDWLFRAYQGGLRLVVVHAVNNQDMFGRGENRLPLWLKPILALVGSGAQPASHRTSNDMEALEHQVRAAHALAAWVAEHRGGWLAIAQTPQEAGQLIAAGKMALVLGSEVDHPLNCDLGRRCSPSHIREGLTKLEALGIAVIFPTHHKLTQFGDSANFQPLNTGPLRPCAAFNMDCAAIGLTAKGEMFVQEMMARGLMTDLGHAGDRPFDKTMQLLEAATYPAIMSHAAAHPLRPNGAAEYTLTYQQLRRLDEVGGMISLHSAENEYAGQTNEGAPMPFASTDGGGGYAQSFLYSRDALQGAYFDPKDLSQGGQLAFAADWNGFAGWPYGRFSEQAKPRRALVATGEPMIQPPRLAYPLSLPTNLVPAAVGGTTQLPLMEFANVSFDFNETGLAHAGLSPDLLADMRLHGLSATDLDPFYRSARGFVSMWQRARNAAVANDRGWLRWIPPSATDLIDFEHLDRTRLIEVAPGIGICRSRAKGHIGSWRNQDCQLISQPNEPEQIEASEVRNANSGMCLQAATTLQQAPCDDSASQLWLFVPEQSGSDIGLLKTNAGNNCLSMNNGNAVSETCSEASSPSQQLRVQRIGNTFRIQPTNQAVDRRCLHIADRSLDAGAKAINAACPPPGRADFHWEIDSIRNARDSDRLFSTKALADTVIWSKQASDDFPHPVSSADGRALCRVQGQLGFITEAQCQGPNITSTTGDYEQLLASTPLRHD